MQKTVLITGVSRTPGIGAALARRAAQNGFNVVITYFRPYDEPLPEWEKDGYDVDEIVRELQSFPVQSRHIEIDLKKLDAQHELFDFCEKEIGPVYALINNACVSKNDTLDTITDSQLGDHFLVNVRAPIFLSQEFVRRFRQQSLYKTGRIINLTSGRVLEPMPNEISYAITKAALERFTTSIAPTAAEHGITANALDPGPTDTGWMDDATKRKLLEHSPMGRLGEPDDVANVVEFLLSEQSQWITGQLLHSRGGFE